MSYEDENKLLKMVIETQASRIADQAFTHDQQLVSYTYFMPASFVALNPGTMDFQFVLQRIFFALLNFP